MTGAYTSGARETLAPASAASPRRGVVAGAGELTQRREDDRAAPEKTSDRTTGIAAGRRIRRAAHISTTRSRARDTVCRASLERPRSVTRGVASRHGSWRWLPADQEAPGTFAKISKAVDITERRAAPRYRGTRPAVPRGHGRADARPRPRGFSCMPPSVPAPEGPPSTPSPGGGATAAENT